MMGKDRYGYITPAFSGPHIVYKGGGGGGGFWIRPTHPTLDPPRSPHPSYNSVGSNFCEPS